MSTPLFSPASLGNGRAGWWLFLIAVIVTFAVYQTGLGGGFLFDDYPNIVENHGVQPAHASVPALIRAALSSPSSEFRRPLASLSFAANYLASGLDPWWMKLTNVVIHLLNGLLVFLLSRALLMSVGSPITPANLGPGHLREAAVPITDQDSEERFSQSRDALARSSIVAALIAAGWLLLPINLTGVLYVVQRMESMANLFVMLGLIGYVAGRNRMLGPLWPVPQRAIARERAGRFSPVMSGLLLCAASITVPVVFGLLAKETAVLLPLYAVLIEWIVFRFALARFARSGEPVRYDRRIIALFVVVLALPLVVGLAWLLPGVLKPETWATRTFTLHSRLLSEARIVVDYVCWTLCPTPGSLSFYHDDFFISQGLLTPWTTLASVIVLSFMAGLVFWMRRRWPLAALGIALFLGCQLLTATVIPLELIYEHRNYFASFGLLLMLIPWLAAPRKAPFALPRHVLLVGLMLCWTLLTLMTAHAWGDPLRLALDLAWRAPESPRAQYELGRTYIIYSRYDPASPYASLAYAPLERAATLRDSSILPEQALIFMNARMALPLKDAWWNSLIAKLRSRKPTVQDESSLSALVQCMQDHRCNLPAARMSAAFSAALSHPFPSSRLLSYYGDFCWNTLGEEKVAEQVIRAAVAANPSEPAYRITLIRMQASLGLSEQARESLKQLEALNVGGRLNDALAELRALPGIR